MKTRGEKGKTISERFGAGMCQAGIAFAFLFYLMTSAALLPIGSPGRGMRRYSAASAADWGPTIILTLLAGCLLWLYRRRAHDSVILPLGLALSALGAVLSSVRYPVGVVMILCFSGSTSLVFDALVPGSAGLKPLTLVLLNLLLCALGLLVGALALGAAYAFASPG